MRYDTIDKLPLNIYFDCLFEGNYNLLSDEEGDDVKELWDAISSQYTSALKNTELTAYTTLVNMRDKEYYTLKIVHMAIYALSKVYDEEMISILKFHGYNYKFDIKNEESYLKDLEKAKIRSNAIIRRIERLDNEIMKSVKESRDEEFNRQTLSNNLANLSKFMGFSIDEKAITTGRYVGILNLYYSYIENLRNAEHRKN